ncbi:MAG: enoyl-CoA hydratase-related protein [Pseudohongiellaceae bacterium]|nr:enoyl-CoA hydratase-related protein [Pseudohongiellaceae bacterium]
MTSAPSQSSDILVEQSNFILTITLNRPERLNAISGDMLNDLASTLKAANSNPDVRVIIITGAGKGFCSGLDLKDTQKKLAAGEGVGLTRKATQLFNLDQSPITALWEMDKPVIAAINGAAAGFGMDMALLADMRIMSENAKLAATMVKRNVVPESGGTWLLPRLIGWGKAAEIFYRGLNLGAQECAQLNLANAVVPADKLMETAVNWAQEIAANGPLAVQTTKRMMRLGMDQTFEGTVDHLLMHFTALTKTDDFKEALLAFNEKRAPNFKGS